MNLLSKKLSAFYLNEDGIRACLFVKGKNNSIKKKKFWGIDIPPGVIENSKIIDKNLLKRFIREAKKELGIKETYICFPESEEIFDFFQKEVKIKPLGIEKIGETSAHALIKNDDLSTYMLLEINKSKTNIFVSQNKNVCFSKTIFIGSNFIFDLLTEKNWGLEIFYDQINEHFLEWHLDRKKEELKEKLIKKILVFGSAPNLREISSFLTFKFRTKVELGNVWVNIIKDFNKELPELTLFESLSYAPVIGACLKH